MKKDIESIDDIKKLVNIFYDKIRLNDLLGPVFNHVIKDNWPEHLEKMVRFWQTILLYEHTYSGTPFPPHAKLPIEKIHFETWVALFQNTVDDLFVGEKGLKELRLYMLEMKNNYFEFMGDERLL